VPGVKNIDVEARIGFTFHRSFPLSLPSIAQVLTVAVHHKGQLTAEIIREETSLGTIYVEAMPRYARGCGLLEMGSYKPTPLGMVVYEHDPDLRREVTWWLMHYHLSAPQGPGPAFWSELVRTALPFGEEIPNTRLAAKLADFLESRPGAKTLQPRTVQSTATVFVGSYTRSDALGGLGLLAETGQRGEKRLIVAGPKSPPPFVVGYALADYWETNYRDQVTMDLDLLGRDDGFARVLWSDANHLEDALDELRRASLLDIFRVAPPYQVARLWSSKQDFVGRLYG
jgi:hypothetical protein